MTTVKRQTLLFLVLAPLFAGTSSVTAQEIERAFQEDLAAIEELGVPTVDDVGALEDQAFLAFDAGNCTAAIPLLSDLARTQIWSQT